MKKALNKTLWLSIITSIVFVIMGFVLILEPKTSLTVISYILCIVLMANGVYQILTEYKNTNQMSLLDGFTGGILSFVLGIFILLKPVALSLLVCFALGIWIIISSSYKFRISMILKIQEEPIWLLTLILSILTMVCGVLLLLNPLGGILTIAQIIGILIIIYSVIDIIEAFIFKSNMKKIEQFFE